MESSGHNSLFAWVNPENLLDSKMELVLRMYSMNDLLALDQTIEVRQQQTNDQSS